MMDANDVINGLKSILSFCLLIGSVGLCVLLVAGAVLRWISPQDQRVKRLNKLAAYAAVILCVMLLPAIWGMFTAAEDSRDIAGSVVTFTQSFSLTLKLMLLGTLAASAAMLVLAAALFLFHGLKAVFSSGGKETRLLEQELTDISDQLLAIMKSRIMIAVITWGILALFVSLPFLMGGGSNDKTAAGIWREGVYTIVAFGSSSQTEQAPQSEDPNNSPSGESNSDQPAAGQSGVSEPSDDSGSTEENDFFQALIRYILFAVIVLGVSFAVFKLLYSIIFRTFATKRTTDLIDEYSGSIGVLSVGVAILLTLQKTDGDDNMSDLFNGLPLSLLKSFGSVMLIVALIVLTLEIIRLLLDMRERLIRQEAKYLFVALVGEASLLLLSALNAVYSALNHAMGNLDDSALTRVLEHIRDKIILTMEQHLSDTKEYSRTFTAFSETVSKDEEEEEEY